MGKILGLKYPEFEMFVKNNNYPKREKSIFFQKSLDDQYRIEAQAYTSRYEKLIKDWRKETISLPSKLVFQCPYCNKDTEVNFKFNGPGYSVGIRGDNMNTIQKTEEITTDMLQEIKRLLIQENNLLRRKLKPNHKYHWRNIISLTGKCTSCEKNIFMDHGLSSDYINFNFINTSFGTSSIYPYYDSESAKEFHGVWGTFYSYLALDYKNNTK